MTHNGTPTPTEAPQFPTTLHTIGALLAEVAKGASQVMDRAEELRAVLIHTARELYEVELGLGLGATYGKIRKIRQGLVKAIDSPPPGLPAFTDMEE